MSYQCEHDGEHDDEQQTPDPANCVWCLLNLEYSLRLLGNNLAIGGALCAAHQIGADPPVAREVVVTLTSGVECVVLDRWYPGCGRPVTEPGDGWEP